MALSSMTGFARAAGRFGPLAWQWELRSVNGRGLDLRLRLPPGFDALEAPVRERLGKRMARGNVNVTLSIDRTTATAEIRVNASVLTTLTEVAQRLAANTGVAPPTADGLLALKGVIEQAEPAEADVEARAAAMVESLDEAARKLAEARGEEGRRLSVVIGAQVDQIERLAGLIERSPSRSLEAVKARLSIQVARLVEASSALDPVRLHQEAALLAVKADVDEELARLRSHVVAVRELLAAREPVGRKLDFLAQELNREANTLCSKANDVEVTRLGLELKVVIDQMREQVQNIE